MRKRKWETGKNGKNGKEEINKNKNKKLILAPNRNIDH